MCAFAMYDSITSTHGLRRGVEPAKVAAYRAPGAPNSSFGVESFCVDELARELKIDRWRCAR